MKEFLNHPAVVATIVAIGAAIVRRIEKGRMRRKHKSPYSE